jgi:hypothetical protein
MDSRARRTRESIHEPGYTGECMGPPSDWQWGEGKPECNFGLNL